MDFESKLKTLYFSEIISGSIHSLKNTINIGNEILKIEELYSELDKNNIFYKRYRSKYDIYFNNKYIKCHQYFIDKNDYEIILIGQQILRKHFNENYSIIPDKISVYEKGSCDLEDGEDLDIFDYQCLVFFNSNFTSGELLINNHKVKEDFMGSKINYFICLSNASLSLSSIDEGSIIVISYRIKNFINFSIIKNEIIKNEYIDNNCYKKPIENNIILNYKHSIAEFLLREQINHTITYNPFNSINKLKEMLHFILPFTYNEFEEEDLKYTNEIMNKILENKLEDIDDDYNGINQEYEKSKNKIIPSKFILLGNNYSKAINDVYTECLCDLYQIKKYYQYYKYIVINPKLEKIVK